MPIKRTLMKANGLQILTDTVLSLGGNDARVKFKDSKGKYHNATAEIEDLGTQQSGADMTLIISIDEDNK